MTLLENILTSYRMGFYEEPEDAAKEIKDMFLNALEDAACGMSSVDASDMYGKMRKFIENA